MVLCGGEGRRMAGRDKPLELLAGKPLVAHVVERLAPQAQRIIVSCNRNLDRYAAYGDARVTDETPGRGPLGGLVSAIAHVRTPWVFACPGDLPLLARDLIARLWAEQLRSGAAALYAHDGERGQPLCLLLRTTHEHELRAYLEQGERSVFGWLARVAGVVVPCSDIKDSFANANNEVALAELEARLTREHHHSVR